MKLLKKEVFYINKVTVVGSPTITSDGVLTGNGVTIDLTFGDDWDLIFPYNRPTAVEWHTLETIFRNATTNYDDFSIGSYGTQYYLWVKDVSGNAYNTAFSPYDGYGTFTNDLIKLSCKNGIDLKVYVSKDKGSNWKLQKSITSTSKLMMCSKTIKFRINTLNIDTNASIPLSLLSFTSNGQLVYNTLKPTYLMEKRKEGYDPSKFTVVGSPTITDEGVASGFDSANANNIQIPTAIISQIATANTWKVEVSGTVQESGFTFSNVTASNNERYDLIQLKRYTNGFIFVCCLDENGTATSKNIPITFSNTYNGKAYKATLKFTGTKYIATVRFEDGKVLTNSLDSTYKIKFFNYGDKFELGYKCINGQIDLPSISITVDNKEVFTGAKEEYYMFK